MSFWPLKIKNLCLIHFKYNNDSLYFLLSCNTSFFAFFHLTFSYHSGEMLCVFNSGTALILGSSELVPNSRYSQLVWSWKLALKMETGFKDKGRDNCIAAFLPKDGCLLSSSFTGRVHFSLELPVQAFGFWTSCVLQDTTTDSARSSESYAVH